VAAGDESKFKPQISNEDDMNIEFNLNSHFKIKKFYRVIKKYFTRRYSSNAILVMLET